MRSRADRRSRLRNLGAVGLLSMVVALVVVLQLRSEALVARTLEGADPTTLAFLIDDLHRSNEELSSQATALGSEKDGVAHGGGRADSALQAERVRLRTAEGLDPVHGPGVVMTIDAPLTSIDLLDAVNNLRTAGAEAIAVDARRVITGTAIRQRGGTVTIEGRPVGGPWTLAAIGDPARLDGAAETMTRSLQADGRVRSASYRSEADVRIVATVAQRPYVYASA